MMWRSNACVQCICIIWMLFNCSANADDTKFATKTTVNRAINDVPTASLFVINGNHEASNKKTNIRPSSFQHDNPFDYAHKTNINESSQRNAGDLVLLSKLPVNYHENRYENSETQSIVESQRHKRTTEQDMCSTGECQCKTEAKQFLTVDCNFRQVSILFCIFNGSLLHSFSLYSHTHTQKLIKSVEFERYSCVPHCRTILKLACLISRFCRFCKCADCIEIYLSIKTSCSLNA